MTSSVASRPRLLFLGRKGCRHSQSLIDHLHFTGFDVHAVFSGGRSDGGLSSDIHAWAGDYILAFRSLIIVPKWLLARASVAAINIHPGPPEYPGSGCLNWALFDGASEYGVTAHIMHERVDSGPILECRRFPILPQDNVDSLLSRTHSKALDLAQDIATGLSLDGAAYVEHLLDSSRNEYWGGPARSIREIDELQAIDAQTITPAEVTRIVRATHTRAFPVHAMIGGRRFVLQEGWNVFEGIEDPRG